MDCAIFGFPVIVFRIYPFHAPFLLAIWLVRLICEVDIHSVGAATEIEVVVGKMQCDHSILFFIVGTVVFVCF